MKTAALNPLQRAARSFIHAAFRLAVWTMIRLRSTRSCKALHDELKTLPEGTLGHDIAACLKGYRLRLVPGFESHDLKHVLLGFGMNPVDEIRLQAFMLGNGNLTFPSIAIFLFGALLLPDCWAQFYRDFCRGRNALPIRAWTVQEYASHDSDQLRAAIFRPSLQPPDFMKPAIRFCAVAAVAAGALGMLYCLPFLFSSLLEDLVGAGFAFLAGTVLFAAGLIALSRLVERKMPAGATL